MQKSISCSMFVTTWVSSELGQFKLNTVCIYCNTRIVYAKLITVGYAKSLLSQSYHRIFSNASIRRHSTFSFSLPMFTVFRNTSGDYQFHSRLPVSSVYPPTSQHQLAGIQITHLCEITNHVGRHSVTVGFIIK